MRIVVYDDSLEFGGHQMMACRGIEALAEDPGIEVYVLSHPANQRLRERLNAIPRLQILDASESTRRLQGIRNRLDRQGIHALGRQIRSLNPDRVLCIQGDIEQSSRAVLACRRAGIDCVSYIAIPHTLRIMGARMGKLRDLTNHYLLNQADRYIAISESMKNMLRERGVQKPVCVVPNGTENPPIRARELNALNPTLGLFGRIEFKQKRQDFMIKTFCNHRDTFKDCRLIIAGSGPDEYRLKQLAEQCPRHSDITIHPWQNSMDALYDQIDFLLLPSRFEGVPIVMLEALARGIPVLGSARDGMAEYLPPSWLFEPGNADALATTFSDMRRTWPDDIDRLQQSVLTKMSIETFKTSFHQAVSASASE